MRAIVFSLRQTQGDLGGVRSLGADDGSLPRRVNEKPPPKVGVFHLMLCDEGFEEEVVRIARLTVPSLAAEK